MKSGHHAQHTKRFFMHGVGLLSLCCGAGLVLLMLEPRPSLDMKPVSVLDSKPLMRRPVAASQVRTQDELSPIVAPSVAVERQQVQTTQGSTEEPIEAAPETVEVVAPGRIRLTEEQAEALKTRGTSWGSDNPEAEAVLRSIPKEAFTSEW